MSTILVDGIERPLHNNEGRLIHVSEAGIVNFWRWFGASCVTDHGGRPIVVYHATTFSFDYFATDSGAHFGTLHHAEEIVDRHDFNGNTSGLNILPVYLSINRFKRVSDVGPNVDEWKEAKQAAIEDGYDGFVYMNAFEAAGDETDSYVAFHPTQVKSALGNSGAFDPVSPDLCCSSGQHSLQRGATQQSVSIRRRDEEGLSP